MNLKQGTRALVAAAALFTPFVVTACEDDITQTEVEETLLLSIAPQGGAIDVDQTGLIVIDFSHSMMAGMDQYADVHEGHVEGTLVPGSWSWNEGRTKMTFAPGSPLKPLTQYVVHLGGGMQDQAGQNINFEEHGFGTGNGGMGGQWMTQGMHQGGNHGNGTGMGGMGMGTNWNHPTNGSFGMVFTFTTGGSPLLLSIAPQGGAMDVDQNGLIVIDFSHSMMEGMEQYADVHEGHVEGTLVPGSWAWNEGRTKMTFTPGSALKPLTQYVVHLGGGMQDQTGHHIDFEEHGFGTGNGGMGGQWMTQDMHQGGNHGNGTGMGGMGMGTNWNHPTNGSFGMVFTFTTGGSPLLLSIVPQGGSMGVDQNGLIVIDFSHSMMEGMEQYADVHEDHVEGTLVPGSWSWNEGRTKMTFTPGSALKPLTQYVVHLGGGMQDQTGHHIDFEEHGFGTGNGGMGGQWMTQDMHQGGNHGYGTGMGGMGMGTGWNHPTNGGYGMTFTFTTG